MSDTPESVREVVTGLYWADAKLSEVRAAIEALERYAELLEQHTALKARVEEYERLFGSISMPGEQRVDQVE